jgi:hypothetical protein
LGCLKTKHFDETFSVKCSGNSRCVGFMERRILTVSAKLGKRR